ncbi:MAG: hypothetical protein QM770_15615 [Tepidisphaeraceae bacterium]
MLQKLVALLAATSALCSPLGCGHSDATPKRLVPQGIHAHNDHLHTTSLSSALDAGVSSVEVDVYLVNGELVIGPQGRTPRITLKEGYLFPLLRRVVENDGWVYPTKRGQSLILLIDVKSDAAPAMRALVDELKSFGQILTTNRSSDSVDVAAISVVVTGQRDTSDALRIGPHVILFDRTSKEQSMPSWLNPLISDAWADHFEWDGHGAMPAAQQDRLRDYVAAIHRQGKLVRFWNAPDTPECWKAQQAAGVDLIHSDRPAQACAFLDTGRMPTTATSQP